MNFLCSAFEWWCLHPFWHPRRWSISILSRSHTMQMDVMESTKFNRTTEMHIFREREKLCMLMLCALCVLYSTASSIYISTITATANSFDNNTHHRHRHHCNSIFLFSSCIYFMSTLFAIAFATKANTHTQSNIQDVFREPILQLGCQNENIKVSYSLQWTKKRTALFSSSSSCSFVAAVCFLFNGYDGTFEMHIDHRTMP